VRGLSRAASGVVQMMGASTKPASPVPDVRFDDEDVDRDEDQAELSGRLSALATARLAAARARLEHLGIIRSRGRARVDRAAWRMLPNSDTTLETG
jgi:hypothetical protein